MLLNEAAKVIVAAIRADVKRTTGFQVLEPSSLSRTSSNSTTVPVVCCGVRQETARVVPQQQRNDQKQRADAQKSMTNVSELFHCYVLRARPE